MMKVEKLKRSYISSDFKVDTWENLKPFFEELKQRPIHSSKDLYQWFLDSSELDSILEEEMGWRYVRMTCDTTNKEASEHFNYFVAEIQPQMAPFANELNLKAYQSPYLDALVEEKGLKNLVRSLKKDIEIYREKNILLQSELEQEAQEFGVVNGAMTVHLDDKELTLQQASTKLQLNDRNKREEAFLKIMERRWVEKDKLNDLYTRLITKRHQLALNADYKNFRDYMFVAMGRFDYNVHDVFNFHSSIKKHVVPLIEKITQERHAALGYETLKPWDLAVNYFGSQPLTPFESGEDLLDKTITCFGKINANLAEVLVTMKAMKHLDLESRIGKAPGGYNYPLDESNVPFIFMNAAKSLRDLVTLVHEGGHAYHSILVGQQPLQFFKHPTSEVAELASMSMELFSMEYWDVFFTNENDLKRAKREHLEGILSTLPWVAIIDKFQHWIYENPSHSIAEREAMWLNISQEFSSNSTDWKGIEHFKTIAWQKQLHLFEVPFYYIEYGMAQLGAIALWKQFKENPIKTFENYTKALQLGYSQSIPEIYATAGIAFDFSEKNIAELAQFVWKELQAVTPSIQQN